MSVPLYDRSKSPIQFIEDSIELTKDVVAWAKRQSKRSFEFFVKDLIIAAGNTLYYSLIANKIRLNSEKNYKKRQEYFGIAIDNIKDFHRILTIIYYANINPVTENQLDKWTGLARKINKQIDNISKSDKKRMLEMGVLPTKAKNDKK